ncbi:polysaccharide deacetylase family protein [Pseudalkalibacillus salsuginis]|uniref:polysaccharide deacetylase family protein n=1 Tax=Pseudalkalibacillus salsuginis TaxID=2910972 RepID=UPI001F21EB90|nr:polysaccharide deacetylase family protein [Pseudalkalibacillus salsuginis]MCF6410617.1 polysaccharide deacetylase family protein [Pseudalkalibacillus salsuginis]
MEGYKTIIISASILLIAYISVQNPLSHRYISTLKNDGFTAATVTDSKAGPLLDQIKIYASEHDIEPVDARIDPVWKSIPGYNGLSVDIEASYERMKKKKAFDESLIVYKQTKPEISLEDLPPSPIYKGNPEKPMVTFLVNVAWGNEHLPEILATMRKHKIHTTFFLDGSWVKKNQELAKVIFDEGHEIGNHAYSHPDMKTLTNQRIKDEIHKTNDIIQSTLEVTPTWFAPPSGSYRMDVVKIASSMNMYTILWSLDTIDWRKPDPTKMANRVVNKIHPGAMVLMHPTSSTAKGLEQMIQGIRAKGYSIGTVSQLMSEKRLVKADKLGEADK